VDSEELEALYNLLAQDLPPNDGIDRDENWLKEELTQAHALFTQDWSYARDGTRRALGAVIGYIEENADWLSGDTMLLLLPLRRLAQALEALDVGFVEPLLAPSPRGSGARPLSTVELEFRFLVALAVLFRAREVGIDAACVQVARELDRFGFKQQRLKDGHYEAITDVTVKNWFNNMPKNWSTIHDATKLTFQQYLRVYVMGPVALSTTALMDLDDPQPFFRALLSAIRHQFGHFAV
jgi:hypothetical protein